MTDLDDRLRVHERIVLLIAEQEGREAIHRIVDRHTDAQRARDDALCVVEFLIHRVQLARDRLKMAQDDLARRRELDALPRTKDEDDAELLFELTDALGHGGLRRIHFLCGARDIARPLQGHKQLDVLRIHVLLLPVVRETYFAFIIS